MPEAAGRERGDHREVEHPLVYVGACRGLGELRGVDGELGAVVVDAHNLVPVPRREGSSGSPVPTGDTYYRAGTSTWDERAPDRSRQLGPQRVRDRRREVGRVLLDLRLRAGADDDRRDRLVPQGKLHGRGGQRHPVPRARGGQRVDPCPDLGWHRPVVEARVRAGAREHPAVENAAHHDVHPYGPHTWAAALPPPNRSSPVCSRLSASEAYTPSAV